MTQTNLSTPNPLNFLYHIYTLTELFSLCSQWLCDKINNELTNNKNSQNRLIVKKKSYNFVLNWKINICNSKFSGEDIERLVGPV